MAHRGLLREVFQVACVALLFGKSEKEDIPAPPVYIEMSDPQGYFMPKMVPLQQPSPAEPTGLLPFILSIVIMLASSLGEQYLWFLVGKFARFFLPPFVRVTKRCLRLFRRNASRALSHPSDRLVHVGTQTQTDGPGIRSATGDEVALTKLKSNHAEEVSQLWVKIYGAMGALGSEREAKSRLLENLRSAVDPHGYYANETVERAADAQARDVERLTYQVERKRRETKAALMKAAETTRLSKENWILKDKVESATRNVEHAKTTAFHRERQLRKEIKEVHDYASTGTTPLTSYRNQLAKVHSLEVALKIARKATIDKEEEGRVEVERVRDQLTSVQSLVQQLTSNQAPDESSQAEGQLALERALEDQRTAERKLEESEKKARESAATVSQLEQSLSKARDDVRLSSDNDQRLQQRLDTALAALDEKQGPAAPDAALSAEIESLRSQLKDVTSQASEQYQNGYLAAIAQNPPADQGQEASTQTDHEENNGSGSGDGELRSEIEQLKAAKNELEQKLDSQKSQAEEAVLGAQRQAQRQAQEWLAAAKAQARNEAATMYNQQWAAASASNEAELQRVRNLGRQVEDDRNAIAQQLLVAREQLEQVTDNYNSAINRLENPEGSLKDSSDVLDTVMARAEAAEEEVKKYKSGKAAQDDRLRYLNAENDALRKNARGELEAAENTANMNDKVRATALTDELVNRHYDHPSRIAATQLMSANAKIMELKLLLNKSRTRYSQVTCLQILQHAEVDDAYKSFDGKMRVVLMKQCEGVNAKLMVLKAMINNGPRDPTKAELLQEIYNARGDELAVWDDEEEPSSESSDEDEDDDDNAGEGSSTGASRKPFVPRPLPTSRRPRQTTPAGIPETPLPSDPRPNNALKRKEIGDGGDDDDNAGEGSSKRKDTSEMGMRPISPPSQGQSSPSLAPHSLQPKPTRIPAPTTAIASLITQYTDNNNDTTPAPFAEGHTGFTFAVPRDIALAGPLPSSSQTPTTTTTTAPPQAPPAATHERIFTTGLLPLPGSSLTSKKAALPGLPAPSDDDDDDGGAVDFLVGLGSASAARDSDEEAQEEADRIVAHLAGRDEDDDDETAWEASLYSYDDFD